jgi:hypothetical protein
MLDGVEEELLSRSFLFVDPISYRDGVGAATEAMRVMLKKVTVANVEIRQS